MSNRRRTWLAVLGVSLLVVLSQSPQMSKADVLVDEDGTLTSYCDYKDYEFSLVNCQSPQLTIELSWNGNADIDLLLFAPDGTYMIGEDITNGYNGRSCLSGIVPSNDGILCDGKGSCSPINGIISASYTGYTSKPERITIQFAINWDQVGSPTLKGTWKVRVVRFSPQSGNTDFHVKITVSGCGGGVEGFSVTPNAIVANVYPSGECSGCQCPMSATTHTLRIDASGVAGNRTSMKMKLMDEDLSWWVSNVPYNDVIEIGTIPEGESIVDFNMQICNPGKKFEITQLAMKTPQITSIAYATVHNVWTHRDPRLSTPGEEIKVMGFKASACCVGYGQCPPLSAIVVGRGIDTDVPDCDPTAPGPQPYIYHGFIDYNGNNQPDPGDYYFVVIPSDDRTRNMYSYNMLIIDTNSDSTYNDGVDVTMAAWDTGDGLWRTVNWSGKYYQWIDLEPWDGSRDIKIDDDSETVEINTLPITVGTVEVWLAYEDIDGPRNPHPDPLFTERLSGFLGTNYEIMYGLDAIPTTKGFGYRYGFDPRTDTEWLLADNPNIATQGFDTVYIHKTNDDATLRTAIGERYTGYFWNDPVNYMSPLGYGPNFQILLRDVNNDGILDINYSKAQKLDHVILNSQLYEIDPDGDYVRYASSVASSMSYAFIHRENVALGSNDEVRDINPEDEPNVNPHDDNPDMIYGMYNNVEYLLVDWDGDSIFEPEDRLFWHHIADDDFRDDQDMYILAVDPDGEWFYGLQKCCMFDCTNGLVCPGKGCFPEFCGVDGDPFFPTIENITGIDIDTTERYGFGLIDFNRDWEYDYEFLITDSDGDGKADTIRLHPANDNDFTDDPVYHVGDIFEAMGLEWEIVKLDWCPHCVIIEPKDKEIEGYVVIWLDDNEDNEPDKQERQVKVKVKIRFVKEYPGSSGR